MMVKKNTKNSIYLKPNVQKNMLIYTNIQGPT